MSSIQDTIKQQIIVNINMILCQHLKLNLFRRKLKKRRVYIYICYNESSELDIPRNP